MPSEKSVARIRVMTFNVFYGASTLNMSTKQFCAVKYTCLDTLEQVVRVIREAQADIVGIEEADNHTAVIAEKLGWFYSNRLHAASRFPIYEPEELDQVMMRVEVQPGKMIMFAVVHALSSPYGPYMVQKYGNSLEQVLKVENTFRVPPMQKEIEGAMKWAAKYQAPIIIVGDFNVPSALDWTNAVVKERNLKYSVSWPMSKMFEGFGFKDSYRTVNPDPVRNPGFTWPGIGPEGLGDQDVKDRVDWILFKEDNLTKVINSQVVGELNCDINVQPWPSDHYAVISEFNVTLGTLPEVLSLTTRRFFVGDSIVPLIGQLSPSVRYSLKLDSLADKKSFLYSTSQQNIGTLDLKEGSYRLSLINSISNQTFSNVSLWLYSNDQRSPILSMSKSSFEPNDPVHLHLSRAPGMPRDYLTIHKCPKNSECDDDYVLYYYTGSLVEGHVYIKPPFFNEFNDPLWPLTEGRYQIRLKIDDSEIPVGNYAYFSVKRQSSYAVFLVVFAVILGIMMAVYFAKKKKFCDHTYYKIEKTENTSLQMDSEISPH